MTRWRMGGKKTMAVLLAASMLGAGMSGAVLPGVQTAKAETLSLTLTAKDNQTIVITDEGYTLISYNPYNSSIETGRESAAYTGDYIITGGTADKPLSEARIRIETTECSLTLKNYHASTTKTANLVDSLVMTEQTNSLLWNNIEDSKMNLKVEGTNSLTCSSQSGSHDIGILKGSLTIQGGGKLYMSNVDIANRETGGTIIFDGPSVRSLNSNDSRGINTFGNVKVRSGELYMKTSATSVKASDMSIEGGIVAAGSVMAGTVEVSGAAVLYMTSRTDGTLTATEGIVYNGTVIGFKNTSSASADRWTPVLTGGTGTLYGDPQLAESSYTKPDNSNIGIDLATAGKEDGVTMKLEDVGYTGNPAVPAPVIRVDKMALHKTLVRGVDFEAETDSSQADKIGLGEKKAVITAVDGSGNLNATEGSFQVVQSQTVFDGGVKTYKGEQETDEFGYGDTITVKVVPKPNGIPAATAAAAGAPPETMEVPVEGKAALYAGSTRLTEDVSVGADGSCSMSYDTNQGALKIGSAELTVRYTGNENMADTSETRTLGLGKTIISQQQVSVTPYTGIYDAATHEAVKVQTTGLEDVRASYSYSTDEGVTWSSYQDTCPLVQGAGTIYVKVRIRGDIYQDYETDPLTVSVARRNIAALPAGELQTVFQEGGYYYTATFVCPHPEVSWKQSERTVTLVEGVDYKKLVQSAYSRNIAISNGSGDSAPTVTIEGTGNYEGSVTKKFAIRFYDKTPVYRYSRESSDGWFAGDVTVTADGFTMGEYPTGVEIVDGNVTYEASYTFTGDGVQKKYFFLKEKGTGYITDRKEISVKIDRTAPAFPEKDSSGEYGINMETSWWRQLLTALTFGKYNHSVAVKMRARDEQSGVKAYYYYVDEMAGGVLTQEQLDALGDDAWTKVAADSAGSAVTLTELSANTKQAVYAYAVDAAGNKSAYISTDGAFIDTTAPAITDLTPPDADTPITDGTTSITFQTDENGVLYYYVAEESEPAPTMEQLIAGADGSLPGYGKLSMTAGGINQLKLTGLKGNTSYVVYAGAVDAAGNMTMQVWSVRFRTERTIPAFAGNPVISGTYGQKVKDMSLSQLQALNGVAGSWALVSESEDIPQVGSTARYEAVFTPDDTETAAIVTAQAVLQIAPRNLNAEGVLVENVTGTYVYDGTPKTPQVLISDSYAVIGYEDYSYAYSNHINASTPGALAVITITGKGNYTGTVTRTFTIRKAPAAPNLPSAGIRADYTLTRIGEVALPTGWEWIEADRSKALIVEQPVSATAVYVGEGSGNYEKESALLTVIRKECAHTGGTATCSHKALCEICGREYGELDPTNHEGSYTRGKKEATCTEQGYTGDAYCSYCQTLLKTGETIPETGHTWDAGRVTKQATRTEDGTIEYTCTRCHITKTEVIPAGSMDKPEESAAPSPAPSQSTEPKKSGDPSGTSEPVPSPGGEPKESELPVVIIRGDVDGDGSVTLMDAQMALKAALKIIQLSSWEQQAADVDGQTGVTLTDAQKILKAALKIESL